MFMQLIFTIPRAEYILLKRLFIAIRQSKEYVQIKGIEEHLRTPLSCFIIFLWTFLHVSKTSLKFSLFVGLLSVHSVGLTAQEDFLKTMRSNLFIRKISALYLILLPYYADFSL